MKTLIKTSLLLIPMTLLITLDIYAQLSDSLVFNSIPKPLYWENKPEKFSIKEDVIIIDAGPNTNMFRAPNGKYNNDNAPKLLFKPDSNFVLTASIELSFENKWDAGAIVMKNDSLNWVKYCFEKDYTGANRVVSVVTKDYSDDCNSVEINSNKVYYKVGRSENEFTLYYSTNGEKWFLIRHFHFKSNTEFEIGFLAQSPIGQNCEVKFADIKYVQKGIKDPYKGE